MARDRVGKHFAREEKDRKLHDLSERTRPRDDVEAEQELIEKTEKVEPIHADARPGRNDPCPCGSGKKYKKCCGGKQ